mmetsp:Transcript_26474/g.47962  ORF Transcript_26474/g.47962 Transcript_26474/m.47962 type:complete len:118 (-) Transcript_26474:1040-1393(-)
MTFAVAELLDSTRINRDGSSGQSSVPRSAEYIMVDLFGNSIVIPDSTLVIVLQDVHLIVHVIPAALQVKLPVTGLNVEVSPAIRTGDMLAKAVGVEVGSSDRGETKASIGLASKHFC